MDGNNGQSDENLDVMSKLEEDLQKLTREAELNAENNNVTETNKEVVLQNSQPEEHIETPKVIESETPQEASAGPKNGSPMLIISLGLVVVALLAAIAYVIGMKFFSGTSKQIACTTEAKVCEDGTSVGRNGPNCEFDACPESVATPEATPDPTTDWKTYTNTGMGYRLKFPNDFEIEGLQPGNNTGKATDTSVGVMIFPQQASSSGVPSQLLQIEVDSSANLSRKTFSAWVADAEKSFDDGYELTNKSNITIGSINNVIKLEGNHVYPTNKTPVEAYLFQSGGTNSNYFYVIIAVKNQSQLSIFNQILSTFKFVEATPMGSPASSPSGTPVTY